MSSGDERDFTAPVRCVARHDDARTKHVDPGRRRSCSGPTARTLDALMYVIAGPAGRPLAVVATLRSGEVGSSHPAGALVGRYQAPAAGHLELVLGPLDRAGHSRRRSGICSSAAVPHQSLVDDVFGRTPRQPVLHQADGRRALPAGRPRRRRQRSRPISALPFYSHGSDSQSATRRRRGPYWRSAGGAMRAGRPGRGHRRGCRHRDDSITARLTRRWTSGTVDLLDEDGSYWFHHPMNAEVLAAALARRRSKGSRIAGSRT